MPKFLRRQNTLSPVFKKAANDDGFNRVEGGPASIGTVPVTGDESSGKNEYDVLKEAEAAVSNSSAAKYLVKPARKKRPTLTKLDTSARKIQAIVRGRLQRSGFHARKHESEQEKLKRKLMEEKVQPP